MDLTYLYPHSDVRMLRQAQRELAFDGCANRDENAQNHGACHVLGLESIYFPLVISFHQLKRLQAQCSRPMFQ